VLVAPEIRTTALDPPYIPSIVLGMLPSWRTA
jgi:hypothetical protein